MFNLNKVTLQNDNNKPAKTQSLQDHKYPHSITRANLARVFKDSDANVTDSADKSFKDKPESKHSKN